MQTPPRRDLGFLLPRAAALLVSLGVVAAVTAQAGGYGCRATTSEINAEARPAASPVTTTIDTSPPATATATAVKVGGAPGNAPAQTVPPIHGDHGFLGGTKAPAGDWAMLAPAPTASAARSAAPAVPPAPNQP